MSVPAPPPSADASRVTRSRSQSLDAQSQLAPSGSSPLSVQTRRTLAGAVSASSSAAVEPNQHSAGADASTSAIPFDELSPAAQICALTNDEMVETVLSCWWPRETYLSLIRDFTLDELRQVCGRLKCMAAGGRPRPSSIASRVGK